MNTISSSVSNKSEEKKPKRILHFCDGTLIEYSTDDDNESECSEKNVQKIMVDPGSLGWVDWLRYKTESFGSAAVDACDYLGDSLATFFGITTPKYQFEIDYHNTIKSMESEASDIEIGSISGIKK